MCFCLIFLIIQKTKILLHARVEGWGWGWRVGASQLQNVMVDEICLSAPTYNHGNNIVVLFDALLNFPFTTSETKRDY